MLLEEAAIAEFLGCRHRAATRRTTPHHDDSELGSHTCRAPFLMAMSVSSPLPVLQLPKLSANLHAKEDQAPQISSPQSITLPPPNLSSPSRERTPAIFNSSRHSHDRQSIGSPRESAASISTNNTYFTSDHESTPANYLRSPFLYSPDTPTVYYFSPLSDSNSPQLKAISQYSSVAGFEDPKSDNRKSSLYTCTNGSASSENQSGYGTYPLKNQSGGDANPLGKQSGSDTSMPLSQASDHPQRRERTTKTLSFPSPKARVKLDIEGLSPETLINIVGMEEFISRGGPPMRRSFSTSHVTFSDNGSNIQPTNQKAYYSAQLHTQRPQPTSCLLALDRLFPFKHLKLLSRSSSSNRASHNNSHTNADRASHGRGHEDHNYEELCPPHRHGSICNRRCDVAIASCPSSTVMERPAQEVVNVQKRDTDNGFAYTPVASAFVFSPRRPPAPSHETRSSSEREPYRHSHNYHHHHHHTNGHSCEPKPILKKTSYSHELQGMHAGGAAQKVSTVVLRKAEQAQAPIFYSAPPTSPHGSSESMAMPTCLPMCSFLGIRGAFLCRSKLANGHLHERKLHT